MIEVNSLSRHYSSEGGLRSLISSRRKDALRAVDNVSFHIDAGEVMGLVGESGCGKSTTGRLLVGLDEPTGGRILIQGEDAAAMRARDRKAFHRRVQMIFQDPYGALNPQHTIAEIVARPLIYQGHRRGPALVGKVRDALEQAGLVPVDGYLAKFPHQISGGQRQRVCIARALVLEPDILVADEPISMLDVSIKWGIIRLLKRLASERQISLLYITHDLATVGAICNRIAIMYLGRIVEIGPVAEVLTSPRHPYTAALVSAIPNPDPDTTRVAAAVKGAISEATTLPGGCRFEPRCPHAQPSCTTTDPGMTQAGARGFACFYPLADRAA